MADTVRFTLVAPLAALTPPHIDGIAILPNGAVRLRVTGDPGQYVIEAATNSSTWNEPTNLTATGASFECRRADVGPAERYYRVRLAQ